MDNELFIENEIYTLTDEDGKESEFQLIGKAELDGAYVILKMAEEEGESVFVSIEDDDEFEKAAAYFDEKLIPEIDYDESEEG